MFKVIARTKDCKEYCSWHKTKEEALKSKSCCYGVYPYGNRVKIEEETVTNSI